MKTALVAVAALTLATVPVQAQTEDQAQLVLISGVNGGATGSDVISKVTFTMPSMQGCVAAGESWASVKKIGHNKGWRKFQCFDRY